MMCKVKSSAQYLILHIHVYMHLSVCIVDVHICKYACVLANVNGVQQYVSFNMYVDNIYTEFRRFSSGKRSEQRKPLPSCYPAHRGCSR